MPTKLRIKKNDNVLVVAGKDKGASGKVLRVFPKDSRVLVENVNLIKRHTRANPQAGIQGGIVEKPAPIHVSNVKLICPESGKPTRVGRTRTKDGKGARVCKASGAVIN